MYYIDITLKIVGISVILFTVLYGMLAMLNNHRQDKIIESDSRPTATVWSYHYNGNVYYRWTSDISNDGFDMFTSEEDAINNAEWNGYKVT